MGYRTNIKKGEQNVFSRELGIILFSFNLFLNKIQVKKHENYTFQLIFHPKSKLKLNITQGISHSHLKAPLCIKVCKINKLNIN